MKIKLSELNPNPFKREISKGKLNREQIDTIKSNLKKLGFMGALPVFKKDKSFYLVAGHHRLQALKEIYGNKFEVEVEVHNYNEDQVFRGMVIENLTQRGQRFDETSQNIQAVEDYLKKHPDVLKLCRGDSPRHTNKLNEKYKETIIANDIAEWLDGSKDRVLKKDVILDYMNINTNLDPELKKMVEKKHDKSQEERDNPNTLNMSQAIMLAKISDMKEQKQLAEVLKETREQRVREQGKLITEYKKADEEIKKKVIDKEIDLADVPIENLKKDLKRGFQENLEEDKGKFKIKHFIQVGREAGNRVAGTNDNISRTCLYLKSLDKEVGLKNLSDETLYKIIEAGTTHGRSYTKVMEAVLEARR